VTRVSSFNFEVSTSLFSFVKKGSSTYFRPIVEVTRQTGMIQIQKITLWWYRKYDPPIHCLVQPVFWAIHWWVYN